MLFVGHYSWHITCLIFNFYNTSDRYYLPCTNVGFHTILILLHQEVDAPGWASEGDWLPYNLKLKNVTNHHNWTHALTKNKFSQTCAVVFLLVIPYHWSPFPSPCLIKILNLRRLNPRFFPYILTSKNGSHWDFWKKLSFILLWCICYLIKFSDFFLLFWI